MIVATFLISLRENPNSLLKSFQFYAVQEFVCGRDVFVSLPVSTGSSIYKYGRKSLLTDS